MFNKAGPFLGFKYNNIHSSQFGIVRINTGNRMQYDLLPESTDLTQNVEGVNGTLYYGTVYKKRDFTVNFAFDNMSETQKIQMQSWLGDGEIHELTFDEREEIVYSAKVTGKATLSVIPFEDNGQTIYKGEGAIIFTCYYPFGRKKVEIANPASVETITNYGVQPTYPIFEGTISGSAGYIKISDGTNHIEIYPTRYGTSLVNNITINCETFLITDGSGNILNSDIKSGDFFALGKGTRTIQITTSGGATINKIIYYELHY